MQIVLTAKYAKFPFEIDSAGSSRKYSWFREKFENLCLTGYILEFNVRKDAKTREAGEGKPGI